jgi:hypothetical protein
VNNNFFFSSSLSAIKKYREVAPDIPKPKIVDKKNARVASVSRTPYSAGIKARV